MTPEQRREQIVALIRNDGRASVEALADGVGASRETVRRDLAELDSRGLVRKVHGGAVTIEPGLAGAGREGPFASRLLQNVGAKRAIAAAARRLISPGDSLFIDTGSTTLLFAEELANIAGLTVITNSAAIAALAAKAADSQVFMLGGSYRRGGQETVGELAIEQVRQFRATHAFLTVGAVSIAGFMDFDLAEAQVARAMARQAGEVTVLADASKMGCTGVFEIGPLGLARRLVSDAVPAELREAAGAAGVEIVDAAID